MREHLYKAKRADNSEWVEGCLLGDSVIVPKQEFYIEPGVDTAYLDSSLYLYAVNPETVCEYTTKDDINGNKIWENSRVKEKYTEQAGTVRYGEYEDACSKHYGWFIEWDYCQKDRVSHTASFHYWIKHIVVFNNPELLKGGAGE